MPYVFFHNYFPEIAHREIRSFTLLQSSKGRLPPDEFALCEMYCDVAGCDCRRVFFHVISRYRERVEAVIAYGWEDADFYSRWIGDDDPEIVAELQGPALNIGSPQSSLAPALLETITNVVLQDTSYVERIKRHYRMFRNKVNNKSKPSPKRTRKKRKRR